MIASLKWPGAWMWSAWQPERGMAFNSYLFERDGGLVAVDPLPLGEDDLAWLDDAGGVRTIIITNRDHVRACESLVRRFGALVVDDPAPGQELFPGATAVPLANGKSREFAVHLPELRAAIVGDALIGAPAGALSLLPDAKLERPSAFVMGLRALWALHLEALLLCDGQPVFAGADAMLAALLEERAGAEINRINVDDLRFSASDRHEGYAFEDGEVGGFIGARQLGYRVARLGPGKAFCPLHSHEMEEEFFYVMEGTPSVRTLRGTLTCRAGDFIAFPVGPRGTHQLRNDSAAPCTVLMVGMNKTPEVCFYPDSQKVLIDVPGRGLMVRSTPALSYFDGE